MAVKLSELSIKGIHGTMDTISAVTDRKCIICVTAVFDKMLNIWMDLDGKNVSKDLYRSEESVRKQREAFLGGVSLVCVC